MKTRIYATPAVKGLKLCFICHIFFKQFHDDWLWSPSQQTRDAEVNQCWFNFAPSSPTLGQLQINIGTVYRVYLIRCSKFSQFSESIWCRGFKRVSSRKKQILIVEYCYQRLETLALRQNKVGYTPCFRWYIISGVEHVALYAWIMLCLDYQI